MRILIAVVLLGLAVGCGRGGDDPPMRPFTNPGVAFSLTPSAARDCDPGTLYVARVDWSVRREGRVRIEVRIDSPDGQVFARSNEAQGSATTEEWVRRGMWFLLIDRDSGEVLAAQRAGPETCD